MTGRVRWGVAALLGCVCAAGLHAQAGSFTVILEPPVNGTVQLAPPLPPDGIPPARAWR